MSRMWDQDKPFVIAGLLWLGGGAVLLLWVCLPSSRGAAGRTSDRASAALAIHYAAAGPIPPGGRPYDEARAAADREQAELDDALREARAAIEFRPAAELAIPDDAAARGKAYLAIRDKIARELRDRAAKAGVRIPADLDPRKDPGSPPDDDRADELLFRLAMTARVVRAAVAQGGPEVLAIEHPRRGPEGTPLTRRTMTVHLAGGLDEILRFIKTCGAPPADPAKSGRGILIVRSARLTRAKGGGSRRAATVTVAAIGMPEVAPGL